MNNKKIPVIITLGNHDISHNNVIIKDYHNYELFKKFLNNLKKINIKLLDNSIYEDKYIKFTGFTLPANSYHSKNSLTIEKEYYQKLDKKLLSKTKNKLSIAIVHNPMNIKDKEISNILSNFDIILSGHMHNGLIFNFIDKIIHTNIGLIDPDKNFFPKISRNMVKLDNNNKLIISGGITKLSESAKKYSYGNILFPMELNIINIKKNKCKQLDKLYYI